MSRIEVGSLSKIKLEAVRKALSALQSFLNLMPPLSVEGVGVSSRVSSQPVGVEETLRGAKNRCQGTRRLCPAAQVWIGIENGLLHVSELEENLPPNIGRTEWADVGFLWIEGENWKVSLRTSPLYIPQKLITQVYGEEGPKVGTKVKWAGDNNNPHEVYSVATINGGEHKTRQEYLTETLVNFFQ